MEWWLLLLWLAVNEDEMMNRNTNKEEWIAAHLFLLWIPILFRVLLLLFWLFCVLVVRSDGCLLVFSTWTNNETVSTIPSRMVGRLIL